MPHRFPQAPTRSFHRLVKIVRQLRRDCPWDRVQTHRSIRDALLEEAYEVVDALDSRSTSDLRDELGDLLLHIVMHSTIAEQEGEFTLDEVIEQISTKLVRRHPHVFGTRVAKTPAEVKRSWEEIKMEEGRMSALDGIPRAMPALQRALKTLQRSGDAGFQWRTADDAWHKVEEELTEFRSTHGSKRKREQEEELGDLLFALVNYARYLDLSPENALQKTIEKFRRRFHHIERHLNARGSSTRKATLEEMTQAWQQAKPGVRRRSARRR